MPKKLQWKVNVVDIVKGVKTVVNEIQQFKDAMEDPLTEKERKELLKSLSTYMEMSP